MPNMRQEGPIRGGRRLPEVSHQSRQNGLAASARASSSSAVRDSLGSFVASSMRASIKRTL